MTARVNLLPREIEERARARRTTSWVVAAVLAYTALLVIVYIGKLGSVGQAEQERDDAQAQVAELEAEKATLVQYADLDRQVAARENLLTATMATEVSWARVLNDLALTFPPSSSLVTLNATTEGATEAGAAGAPPNPNSESIGSVSFEGYSVDRLAPGVERVLIKFNEVQTFFNAYLTEGNNGRRGRTPVTEFTGTFQLNDEAYTHRYDEGLPPEVAQ